MDQYLREVQMALPHCAKDRRTFLARGRPVRHALLGNRGPLRLLPLDQCFLHVTAGLPKQQGPVQLCGAHHARQAQHGADADEEAAGLRRVHGWVEVTWVAVVVRAAGKMR